MARPARAPVVATLNMKGGVGKTTVAAHVMRVFYHSQRAKTLLVDLDPQFNLTQAVVTRPTYDKLKSSNKTIYAVMEPPSTSGLFDTTVSNEVPPPIAGLIHNLRHIVNTQPPVTLDLLPGDFRLVKYSIIHDKPKLDSVQQRFKRFISSARDDYQLICIDCNPSSSFITHCALHACTHLLVPVRPDRYSILGLELLADLLESMPTIDPKPTLIVQLNGVPRQHYDRQIENELRAHSKFGSVVLANALHQSSLLEARSDYTGFATDKGVPYKKLLKTEIVSIVNELAPKLGFLP
jgi:chromosome partitioning protein